MSSLRRPPSIIAHVVWAVAFAVGFPASLAATRIRQITFDQASQATQSPGVLTRVPRTGRGSGGGIAPFLFRTFVLGAFFVVLDERMGSDILYRAFGLDVLPKTPEQLALRKHRETWREATASGDADRIRETFFRLRRERFDMMGVRYKEEPMKEAPPAEMRGLMDPRDVRVFFIPSKGSNSVVGKVYIMFNARPDVEPGVREGVEWATRWILARQVEAKVVEHCLEMPCRLQRIYRDRSEGEYLLQWSRNEDGSSTLADVWDRRRPRFVTEDGMKPEE